MAVLEVKKIKSRTPKGKWFTAEVEEIQVIKGEIHFLPKNKKYGWYLLKASNCIIIK